MAEQSRAHDGEPVVDTGSRLPLPPARRRPRSAGWWLLPLLLLALVAGVWWSQRGASLPALQQGTAPAVQSSPPVAASAAPPAAEPMAVTPLPEPTVAEGPLPESGVAAALSALVGAGGTGQLISDDFVRRFVVTVDNLGREHAPPRLWPVNPTPGRFQVIERNGALYADPDNAARYTPLVLLAEQIDPQAAVTLYGRMLPLLQQAYEEIGYPGQRFHTRLMAVIDQLLAAPQAPELIPLTLVEVKGEVPSERPWVRYEFSDPKLESANAGQKMMLRVGAVNERRLKMQLRALRAELVRQAQR